MGAEQEKTKASKSMETAKEAGYFGKKMFDYIQILPSMVILVSNGLPQNYIT